MDAAGAARGLSLRCGSSSGSASAIDVHHVEEADVGGPKIREEPRAQAWSHVRKALPARIRRLPHGRSELPWPDERARRPGVLGVPGRFYVWASVIEDGRVVATDYAPDIGWL